MKLQKVQFLSPGSRIRSDPSASPPQADSWFYKIIKFLRLLMNVSILTAPFESEARRSQSGACRARSGQKKLFFIAVCLLYISIATIVVADIQDPRFSRIFLKVTDN